jgi:hypothetical protein
VGLPHLGQLMASDRPQLLQSFHFLSTGLLHFGHLGGPDGVDLPQKGQTLASGGTNSPQYSQGFLYVDIINTFASLTVMSRKMFDGLLSTIFIGLAIS